MFENIALMFNVSDTICNQKNPMGAEDVPHLYTCNYVFEQCFPICDIFETNFKFEVYAIN